MCQAGQASLAIRVPKNRIFAGDLGPCVRAVTFWAKLPDRPFVLLTRTARGGRIAANLRRFLTRLDKGAGLLTV